MDIAASAVVCTGLLAYALLSGKLTGTPITAPLVFIVFGFLIGEGGFAIASVDPGHAAIHVLAEVTLLTVLFTDAARIDLSLLRRDHQLPQRMLVIGLPLVIVFGLLLAVWLLPALSFWEAALLAALLAPTDAALGQSVVSARQVPVRIRQAINVESGLNDGIALPAVLLFAALAGASAAAEVDSGHWLRFTALQIALAPVVGAAIGYVGARSIDAAAQREWAGEAFLGIGILSVAFLAFAISELVGGNGFIAAFVAGMVFGHSIRHRCTFLFEFMETEGQLLMLLTFLVFGAALLPEALAHMDAAMVLYALGSLTLVRIVPIALSLMGTRLAGPSVAFLGWFGPRGLASILFVLLILERSDVPHKDQLLTVTVLTVALSALLHGVSAAPLARIYARRAAAMGECEENKLVTEMPLRHRAE